MRNPLPCSGALRPLRSTPFRNGGVRGTPGDNRLPRRLGVVCKDTEPIVLLTSGDVSPGLFLAAILRHGSLARVRLRIRAGETGWTGVPRAVFIASGAPFREHPLSRHPLRHPTRGARPPVGRKSLCWRGRSAFDPAGTTRLRPPKDRGTLLPGLPATAPFLAIWTVRTAPSVRKSGRWVARNRNIVNGYFCSVMPWLGHSIHEFWVTR